MFNLAELKSLEDSIFILDRFTQLRVENLVLGGTVKDKNIAVRLPPAYIESSSGRSSIC